MYKLEDSVPIKVNTNTNTGGVSVVVINHETNEIFEFTDFIMVGFANGGEYVANNCTIPQVAQGLFRMNNLYDELVVEAQVKDKPKLSLLTTKIQEEKRGKTAEEWDSQ